MDLSRFAGERPDWNALSEMFSDVRRTWADLPNVQKRMLDVRGEAWSDDRLIRAVVGPRGQLVDLEIDPRVYRTPNSAKLSASILATVRAAVDDANAKSRRILEKVMPADRGLGLIATTDADRMMASHDADLPRLMGE
jgi:DNA-binding protein YbaB